MSIFNTISRLRGNIFGGGQSINAINYGGGTSMGRESAIELAQSSPTARLNKDPLGFSSLSYPRDLINDVTNGHYILFYVNRQNNTRFPYTRADNGLSIKGQTITMEKKVANQDIIDGVDPGLARAAGIKPKYEYHEVIEGGGAVQYSGPQESEAAYKRNVGHINTSDVSTLYKEKTRMRTGLSATGMMENNTVRITDSVAIYLPPNVQDNYTTTYNATETGLLGFLAASGGKALDAYKGNNFKEFVSILSGTVGGALEEVLKNIGSSIAETITSAEGGYELANKVFGRSTNPYLEVLFGGPELRTFTYNFTFAPRNIEERDEVQKIIELFRFEQAPELRSNNSMFFGLPSEFDIHYMYQPFDGTQAHENPYYNKIATCVLQSVNVDYTPGAVHSHSDGSPVQIKMSLNFLETEMITKDHVKAGY